MANNQRLDLNKLLPNSLTNDTLSSLVSNLFNRFLSEEQSVLVSGRIGREDPLAINEAKLVNPDLSRDANALVPALYSKTGTQEHIFTFDDFENKLKSLGADVDGMKEWMAEQSFNFAPPIDIDAFVNYANYYWVGKTLPQSYLDRASWNTAGNPEYVVISRPDPSSLKKLPVRFATSRDIKLHAADRVLGGEVENFVVEFVSPTEFTIYGDQGAIIIEDESSNIFNSTAANIPSNVISLSGNTIGTESRFFVSAPDTTPGVGYGLNDSNSDPEPLMEFSITIGSADFQAGDKFEVGVKYFTSQHTVKFIAFNFSPLNKGTLDKVVSTSQMMFIDSTTDRIAVNDRILVWKQSTSQENGIYQVKAGKFVRATDADSDSDLPLNAVVYVNEGDSYGGSIFQLTFKNALAPIIDNELNHLIDFTEIASNAVNPINEWQEFNFWYHRDDILEATGFSHTSPLVTRANRPIIKYHDGLQLNSFINMEGAPDSSGIEYVQTKHVLNQLPQFDLFRYDGTHANKTGAIFFFAEDPDYVVDSVLQKRVKTTENDDYIFGTDVTDENNNLLFFKMDDDIQTIWAAGPTGPVIGTPIFTGGDERGSIAISNIANDADNQIWTITAISDTEFEVVGSRHGKLDNILNVGVPFDADDFTLDISAGINPFEVGEYFEFRMHNKISPRYVKQDEDGNFVNYIGGPAQDRLDNAVEEGIWLTPLRMFQNLDRTFQTEVGLADLNNHFRSIIKAQDGFTGSSMGINNFRTLNVDYGYGGKIREFGSNFPLLASMLIQQDLSPLSILDFAEQQYNLAISSVDQFIVDELPKYIGGIASVPDFAVNPNSATIQKLLEHFEELRGENEILNTVFSDSTCLVKNWPITLPIIGALPAVTPDIVFDEELGIDVVIHHDGHKSPIAIDNLDDKRRMVQEKITRSDGTVSAGIFSVTMPLPPAIKPYARQVWMDNNSRELYVFDVVSDASTPPDSGNIGEYWYDRDADQLYEWDNTVSVWIISSDPLSDRWKLFNVAAIRNSLLLAIENKLYQSVHPALTMLPLNTDIQSIETNPAALDELEVELARYAAKYDYDVFGVDYDASDAFTWNYKQANFFAYPSIVPSIGIARWFDVYAKYFDQPGLTVSTIRPNLEPWKLLNFTTKPAGWDTAYASTTPTTATQILAAAKVVATNNITLFGTQTIDGVLLSVGDRVLVVGQTSSQFNGVYVVSSTGWVRSSDTLIEGTAISITDGSTRKDTTWIITTPDPIIINTTPIIFGQVRIWSNTMWSDIKTARPGLKLCVNTYTDALLPPYVSPSSTVSAEALLTAIPAGVSDTYEFGDNGPIESIWKKSLEYNYGLARVAFKFDPLKFLDSSWGETYVNGFNKDIPTLPSGIRLERAGLNTLPHTKFQLHGERHHHVYTYDSSDIAKRFTYDSISWANGGVLRFEVSHVANNATFIYVIVNETLIGMVEEGEIFSFTHDGIDVVNGKIDDLGIAFRLGDTFQFTFFDDIVDPGYVPPVVSDICEGCTVEGEEQVTATIPMVQVPFQSTFIPANAKKLIGLGQWFTNLLRFSYIDTEYSIAANLFRAWDVRLAHRFGSLIKQDSLKINSSLGLLPTTAYDIVVKRSTNIGSTWVSGIRVQLVEMGERVLNKFGLYVPKADASDWQFRIEVYNSQNPVIDYYVLDTAGPYQTFKAVSGENTELEWRKYTNRLSLVEKYTMPKIIVGLQNTIDILFGYIARIEELGFIADNTIIDEETGRSIDWQLEVEKLIDKIYVGTSAGDGHILNPFTSKIRINTPVGILSRFASNNFNDIYITQAAYDVTGSVIPIDNLEIIRTDDYTTVTSEIPMFSIHVFHDEFEHVALFNDAVSEDINASLVFNSFLGYALDSAYLNFVRQDDVNRKPIFNGFFLSGNNVKRNITGSVDLIGKYYDPVQTFDDENTSRHALSLLGFSKKDYFDDINSTDAAQFNFWRGLIQAKGTNLTINAFVNFKKFNDASTDEYWAYKLAEFGDSRERSFPEIKLSTQDARQKFTQLQFYNSGTIPDELPLYTLISSDDDTRWFGISDLEQGLAFKAQRISETVVANQSGYFRLQNIFHNGDSGAPIVDSPNATLVTANLLRANQAGTYTVTGYTWNNPSKYSPIKLFDYVNESLVQEISLWHPAIGIHAQAALETVNVITNYDPAQYNYSSKTTDNPNYKLLRPWGAKEVGKVWWDTSNLGYIPYYDASLFPSRQDRQERWGLLASWASIDLYEWVESSVPPSEYDAKAAEEEGRIDIPVEERASGEAALKQTYKRDRTISVRPIAWSRAGIGGPGAHPAFGPAEFTKVHHAGGALYADVGRVEQINLVADRRFGAWILGTPSLFIDDKPEGEVIIGDELVYRIGSAEDFLVPTIGIPTDFTISIGSINNGQFGTRIGAISASVRSSTLTIPPDNDAPPGTLPTEIITTYLVLTDSEDFYQQLEISEWDAADGERLNLEFDDFGLILKLIKTGTGLISGADLADDIANNLTDIFIREGVRYTEVIQLPPGIDSFANDSIDPLIEFEWRTWEVPTQDDLDSDLVSPKNVWKPYVGDWVQVAATPTIIADMNSDSSNLTLRSGKEIAKYKVEWTSWTQLVDLRREKISNGTDQITFLKSEFVDINEEIDTNRLLVFADGVQLTPNTNYIIGFDIVENQEVLQIVNNITEGSTVLLIYRAENPSEEQLAFDPDISDNFEQQVQYKQDYQYTITIERDEFGNSIGSKYYFWVKNKTTRTDRKMSIEQATLLLEEGPSEFVLFSRLNTDLPEVAYDSCAIAGLSRFVTKNDTYKLRFTKNFTLRDDPEQLNLKNVHAEWALIRPNQLTKIPESLWNRIVDAVSGTDVGGNPLPSQNRIDYDLRNGTNTRYGFEQGQIFADTELVKATITHTILNTKVKLRIGSSTTIDYISALNFNDSDSWFATPEQARATMNLIWATARGKQINEIFFAVLEDALANNYEFSDIFKTSYITVSSSTVTPTFNVREIEDAIF